MDNLTIAGAPKEVNEKVTKSSLLSIIRDLKSDILYAKRFNTFESLDLTISKLERLVESME